MCDGRLVVAGVVAALLLLAVIVVLASPAAAIASLMPPLRVQLLVEWGLGPGQGQVVVQQQ